MESPEKKTNDDSKTIQKLTQIVCSGQCDQRKYEDETRQHRVPQVLLYFNVIYFHGVDTR